MGHHVKLIPPFVVKPFLVGNKNDKNDALAIAEASMRPNVRFVPVKTLEQQDIQSLQRIRENLIKMRTSTINQCRGLFSEYGYVISKSRRLFKKEAPLILDDNNNSLTVSSSQFLRRMLAFLSELEQQIADVNQQTLSLIEPKCDYQRLITIPGVGPVVAATLMTTPEPHSFKNGRQFSAWIGLTPKQHASGDKNMTKGITKRGNAYLRKLLIQGARTVLNWCGKKTDPFSRWCQQLLCRMNSCKAVVALANKLARIAWAILASKTTFANNMASL